MTNSSDSSVVAVADLVKRYPKADVNAVDGISFSVRHSEVFGLLGPNGAGKTTTVGILTTRALPTSGEAFVGGVNVVHDPVGARTLLAVVPQRNNLDRAISIRQNLLFHAAYHCVPRAEARTRAESLLEAFGLAGRADEKPDYVSGGQAQRIMIARALMHAPSALFLDEPTTGLDPAARLFVWDRIRELKERGTTILLTTHAMDEAAELSDRVGIMDHGKLLALDTPGALTRSLPGNQTLDVTVKADSVDPSLLRTALAELRGVDDVETLGAEPPNLHARLFVSTDASAMIVPLVQVLGELGVTLTDVGIGRPTLEDVFLGLTGRALR
ncbi:MAG TPA: ATP-binding cassette domain-containing protein [Acidimicrobiales bacterium]|nr:ATP-binding cassette domain-containing protein [Acidimicrobiales bacterium]